MTPEEEKTEFRRKQMLPLVEALNALGLVGGAFEFNDDSGNVWHVELKCQRL